MQVLYSQTSTLAFVRRVTTERKGSWRWQNAFRVSMYRPRQTKSGKWVWNSVMRDRKMAYTKPTAHLWTEYGTGSLHNKPARHFIDDFGTLVFVA